MNDIKKSNPAGSNPIRKRICTDGVAESNCSYIPRLDNVLVRFACKISTVKLYMSTEDKFTFKDITIAGIGELVRDLRIGDRVHISSGAIREAALIPENKNRFTLIKRELESRRDLMCISNTINLLPELVKDYNVKTFTEYLAKETSEVVIYQNVRNANIIAILDNDDILEYDMES